MTPCASVYEAFFRFVTDDMYLEMTEEETREDCHGLLLGAIPLFEFPREVIEVMTDAAGTHFFTRNLTLEEENILGLGMVTVWLQRQIHSIEVTRQKYSGSDFKLTSQAAHLKQLTAALAKTQVDFRGRMMTYSRHEVRDGKWVSTFGDITKRMY